MYEITVGNIGSVCQTRSKITAFEEYDAYIVASCSPYGRASGEDVTLWLDGEPIKEYIGDNNQEDNFGEIV